MGAAFVGEDLSWEVMLKRRVEGGGVSFPRSREKARQMEIRARAKALGKEGKSPTKQVFVAKAKRKLSPQIFDYSDWPCYASCRLVLLSWVNGWQCLPSLAMLHSQQSVWQVARSWLSAS